MSQLTRRCFLQSSSAAMAGSSVLLCGTKASGRVLGANDKIRVAVVGVNGRGNNHIQELLKLPDAEIAYLVDPDQSVLARRLKEVETASKGLQKPRGAADLRRVLEDKNVDAISVATPNHWHALMTIWGAQAGKHVYVEKPMSHDILEGRVAVAAQKKYGVVVQHGTQNRSNAKIAGLHEAIKAGKFGRLKISYGYCCKARASIGFKPVEAPPAELDWNLWRGPAEVAAFHRNFVHYNWHWFWETGNGDLNNQGTHQLDIARWALDDDQTHPVKAMAIGGRFLWKDQGVTPNTMFAMAEYPNGQQVFFNVRNVKYEGYETQVENEYYFEDGGRIIRNKYYPKGSREGVDVKVEPGKVTPGGPFGAFLAAVRANDPAMANGNAVDAHNACVLGHVMNNSYRLGKQVPFNAKAGAFGDNKDACEHFLRLHEIMRAGVGLPEAGNSYTVGPVLSFDPKTERFVGDQAKEANALLKDPNRKGFEIPECAGV
ncbi:MAG: Gfo/Idh/MocA family oxidoreductase [Kiritimatiellae bacterium]|nr:Gfo/Idh/MocA family oxidoreductase [Kiritimatiellia bacterium]